MRYTRKGIGGSNPPASAMKFILVRHCTTEWNLAHRLQGQTDIPLCDLGIKEAYEARELLGKFKISKIVSSDLKLASQTAEIINEKFRVDLILDKRLRECAFGSLEGLPSAEAAKAEGREKWDDKYGDYDYTRFGGESQKEVLERHRAVMEENKNNPEPVLFIGHGRGLNTLLAGLGLEPNLKRGEYRII